MLAIKNILFPLDFSDRGCAAAPFVEAMASRFDAKVTLISVAQPIFPGAPLLNTEEIMDELKGRLAGAFVKEFAHLRVERFVEFGDPAQVIIDFAHKNNVDLIMMPTHGYGPFRSVLLGSVTAKVLHDAKCPVWTAAHIEGEPAPNQVNPRNILCAVDATPESIPLMKWAGEFSKSMGVGLLLVHAVPTEGCPPQQMEQFEENLRKGAWQQITKLQASAGVEAPLCIKVGNVEDTVREEARRHNADLIMIGRGVLREKRGRLGTHAYSIIRQAACPVLSV